jgi:hypothetical protein
MRNPTSIPVVMLKPSCISCQVLKTIFRQVMAVIDNTIEKDLSFEERRLK